MPVQTHKELQHYTLPKKFGATNPGKAHGGSSSATHANKPDHTSEVFSGVREFIFAWSTLTILQTLKTHPTTALLRANLAHRRKLNNFFFKNNGRLLTPQMAKAPGGGTGIMKTGSSNQNLETGHNSLTQKVVNHTGVILMGAVSVPPWILG